MTDSFTTHSNLGLVWQKGVTNQALPLPVLLVAMISIYAMIIPIAFADMLLWQYQLIYFGLMKIPKIKRRDYVVIDRHKIKALTGWQKLNCAYCGYANGVASFAKAVAAQTEKYSCAIKHKHIALGQDHQGKFFEYSDFK